MYSDKSKTQRKAAEKSLKLQGRKKLCYLSITFTCLQNKPLPSKQALFSQTAWMRAQSIITSLACANQRKGLHILLLSSHQVFQGSNSAELVLRKLKLSVFTRHLLGSSIPVVTSSLQEVICNSFICLSDINISDQTY